jgi:hypothetical protein
MKCDDCQNLLSEYMDGEAALADAEQVKAHLITCAVCTREFEAFSAEQEIFARYDRELNISPSMWQAIEARTRESQPVDSRSRFSLWAWFGGLLPTTRYGFAGAMAVLIVGVVIGVMYLRTQPSVQVSQPLAGAGAQTPVLPRAQTPPLLPDALIAEVNPPLPAPVEIKSREVRGSVQTNAVAKLNRPSASTATQSDVLFSDIAYSDIENKDTANHITQAENLLRSIRNIHLSDDEGEVDVTYEKAMSRRLLDENVVLRRDAQESGKFPVKTLLADLEPFLVDITNLPDKTNASELRALKDRVHKTEIVAALQSY